MKESLAEEFIIDPETGAKPELEQNEKTLGSRVDPIIRTSRQSGSPAYIIFIRDLNGYGKIAQGDK